MSSRQAGCSDAMKKQLAELYRELALLMFGKGSRDKMFLAEMSMSASIADIEQAENKTKKELAVIAESVRRDGIKNKFAMKDMLMRSRMLRSNLALMAKKRMGMEQHLETLRQSQLNQNMLLSMKHTSDALQTMGMKLSDADNIVLDLEDSTHDINSLQTTLSSNFISSDASDDDLHAELELLLADDMSPGETLRKTEKNERSDKKQIDPAPVTQENVVVVSEPAQLIVSEKEVADNHSECVIADQPLNRNQEALVAEHVLETIKE
jgi:hypothetical protein